MTHEDRLQAIHEILIRMEREQATIAERMVGMRADMQWLEGRIDSLDTSVKPVTWASQTGAVLLWVCALLGGIGTLFRFSGKL